MGCGKNGSTSKADVQSDKEDEKNELFGQIQVSPKQVDIKEQEFHDDCITPRYGRTISITLLDSRSLRLRLCHSYAMAAQSDDQAKLQNEPFDFHRECSVHQWHRLNSLLNLLEPEIVAMRQFRLRSVGPNLPVSVQQESQTGVICTKCIDCRDRTNVVQSMVARRALELGLQQAYLVSSAVRGEKSDFMRTIWPDFEQAFKDVWADNTDVLSAQFSGTKASKRDLTHTDKQTVTGMQLNDSNSADCFLQDAIDLFLGHYSVFNADGSPKKRTRTNASDSAV